MDEFEKWCDTDRAMKCPSNDEYSIAQRAFKAGREAGMAKAADIVVVLNPSTSPDECARAILSAIEGAK